MIFTENVLQQVTVIPMVSVEKTSLLIPMQWAVGCIHIKDHFLSLFEEGIDDMLNEKTIHGSFVQSAILDRAPSCTSYKLIKQNNLTSLKGKMASMPG